MVVKLLSELFICDLSDFKCKVHSNLCDSIFQNYHKLFKKLTDNIAFEKVKLCDLREIEHVEFFVLCFVNCVIFCLTYRIQVS